MLLVNVCKRSRDDDVEHMRPDSLLAALEREFDTPSGTPYLPVGFNCPIFPAVPLFRAASNIDDVMPVYSHTTNTHTHIRQHDSSCITSGAREKTEEGRMETEEWPRHRTRRREDEDQSGDAYQDPIA